MHFNISACLFHSVQITTQTFPPQLICGPHSISAEPNPEDVAIVAIENMIDDAGADLLDKLCTDFDGLQELRATAKKYGSTFGLQSLIFDFAVDMNDQIEQLAETLKSSTNLLLEEIRTECDDIQVKSSAVRRYRILCILIGFLLLCCSQMGPQPDRQTVDDNIGLMKKFTSVSADDMADETSSDCMQYMIDSMDEDERKIVKGETMVKTLRLLSRGA